jgi:GT2 family glycosyltransferase
MQLRIRIINARKAMISPKVAIIIVNWNGWMDTIECIESIRKITYTNHKIILVDNFSTDDSVERIKTWLNDKVKYLFFEENTSIVSEDDQEIVFITTHQNKGFSGGNNVGIRFAQRNKFDYILLLNDDTIVEKGFLETIIAASEKDPTIGISGGKIYFYSDKNRIWSAGGFYKGFGVFGLYGYNLLDNGQFDKIREVDFCVGAFMLIKNDVFEKIGLLPECYFMGMEEGDFALSARKMGYKCIYVPTSVIWHKIGVYSIDNQFKLKYIYNSYRNRLLFIQRHLSFCTRTIWPLLFNIYVNYFMVFYRKLRRRTKNVYAIQMAAKLAIIDHKVNRKISEEDIKSAELVLSKWEK